MELKTIYGIKWYILFFLLMTDIWPIIQKKNLHDWLDFLLLGHNSEVEQVKNRREQRFPLPGEPVCQVCGLYGEYICNEVGHSCIFSFFVNFIFIFFTAFYVFPHLVTPLV